jgi:hypothetical protein
MYYTKNRGFENLGFGNEGFENEGFEGRFFRRGGLLLAADSAESS